MSTPDTKSAVPFVWPSAADTGGENTSRFKELAAPAVNAAQSVSGIVSAFDRQGVQWFEEFLDREAKTKVRIILAVFGGCPTRCSDLKKLLVLQGREEERIKFRILTMDGGSRTPANCLAVVPEDDSGPVFLFGSTPNFGIDSPDRTQVNMGFNPDAVLFDQWRCWFEWTWGQAAPLTEVTAEIPALVPAVGEPKAGAQWLAYCAVCEDASSKRIIGSSEQSANITVDSSTGDVSCDMESDGLGSTTEQTPTEALKLPKLDGLERRICQLVATGQQVTIAHSSAVPPLDVPINQSIFGLKTEQRDGTVVERRSFRISVFSKEELKKINAYRKGSQRLVEQLGLPLETGVYWLPNEVASILEKEIEAKNKEAQKQLKDMVGEDAGNFVQKKIDRINRDLEEVYRRLNNYGSLPGYAVTDIRSELEQRIGRALGGQLVAPVTFSKISFDLQEKGSSQAPWAQPEKLVLALARFPRAAISRPKTLSGLLAPQSEILPAMNVADDAILKVNNWRKRESRAQSELRPLERIVRADIDSRARCEAGFMLIDGKSPSVIEEFLAKKESARREPAQ